ERGGTVASSLSPDTSSNAGAILRDDRLAYALPGQMLIDFRTREVSVDLGEAESRPRISLGKTRRDRGKRIFDVVIVATTAPLWLLLLGVLAFAVKCTSRGPMFYVQERLGRGGHLFRCVKLRTMAVGADVRLEDLLSGDAVLRGEFEGTF